MCQMVEAVGIEPTSEELRSPVSPCAAGVIDLTPGPVVRRPSPGPARKISVTVFGRRGDPARQTASILRWTGGISRLTWLLTQPVRSRYWQLNECPHLFNEAVRTSTRCQRPEPFPVETRTPPIPTLRSHSISTCRAGEKFPAAIVSRKAIDRVP